MDCGVDDNGRGPTFAPGLAQDLLAVFISHSHLDHVGGIPSLVKAGFKGPFLMSGETENYLKGLYPGLLPSLAIKAIEPGVALTVGRELTVDSGKAGHCIGSLWFDIRFRGKRIVFTGDYLEDSPYLCDPIRHRKADIAIIDGSYWHKDVPPLAANLLRLKSLVAKYNGNVLLPVSGNGRGIIVREMLEDWGYETIVRGGLFRENLKAWLKPTSSRSGEKLKGTGQPVVFTDKDFQNPDTRALVENNPDKALILSGSVDDGSVAASYLLNRPHTFQIFFNSHASEGEIKNLLANNAFDKHVLFASKKTLFPTNISF